MGLSLQDQLLKAGIADKKQAQKARQEKRVSRKKNKGKITPPEVNQTEQERLDKARRSQELNRRRNQEKEKLEKLSQARQLIETNRLKLDKYEDPFYFKVGKKIKKLYVNEAIAEKLSCGRLAIVSWEDRFEIVPGKVALQIAERNKEALIVFHSTENDG